MPFNYKEFSAKCDEMTEDQLHKEWENYTRHISGGSASIAISVLAAPFTMGVSLIGLGFSTPRIHNARKKRAITEQHLQALGSTHHTRKRDVLGPMALSSTIGALTLGMAPVGGEVIGEIGITHGIAAICENPATVEAFAHVAADGMGAGVEEVHQKKKAKKVKKQIKRYHESMLREFQRWNIEEEKTKAAVSSNSPSACTVCEDHAQGPDTAQNLSGKEQEVDESDSSDEEGKVDVVPGKEEFSFQDYLEMRKMWDEKNGKGA